MDVERFKSSPVGRLVPVSGTDSRYDEPYDHWAFVPDPLPDDVRLSTGTWKLVSESMMWLGRLDTATARLPNPLLLSRPALRKEAVSTSALEGTYAAFQEILEAELVPDVPRRPQVLEVLNFVRAAEAGLEYIEAKPIGRNLLIQLHETLMRGTAGAAGCGSIRSGLVVIGPEGERVAESRFVPPPHIELDQGISDRERWIHREDDLPLPVRVAMSHYQFETLHPFHDGNGRLGRLIVLLQLAAAGVLKSPVLNISPLLERRRGAYQEGLAQVSATGEWDPWVSFFVDALLVQARSAVTKVDSLVALRDRFVDTLRADKHRGAAVDMAHLLIGYPVVTVNEIATLLNVSYPTANNAASTLVQYGFLEQANPEENYNRIFVSMDALRIIEFGFDLATIDQSAE